MAMVLHDYEIYKNIGNNELENMKTKGNTDFLKLI